MRFFEYCHPFRHAMHRHPCHTGRHGHRGFQGFGWGFGGGERGFPGDSRRGGFGPGRKLGSADLQLLILALLADKPHHGYEIIKALDERSGGYYSPSPGMVYPALTYLEEIGHASVEAEGTKKLYSITVAGLAHLDENRAMADTLLQQLGWLGQRMDHLRRAMGPDEGEGAAGAFEPELRQAWHGLKAALGELRERRGSLPADEQQRIAAILARAVAEIRGR